MQLPTMAILDPFVKLVSYLVVENSSSTKYMKVSTRQLKTNKHESGEGSVIPFLRLILNINQINIRLDQKVKDLKLEFNFSNQLFKWFGLGNIKKLHLFLRKNY